MSNQAPSFTNPRIRVISFGYGHGPAPEADLTADARRNLRNPHHDSVMRELTGLDAVVRDHVLATPGARDLIHHIAVAARDLAAVTAPDRPVTIATGCVGGRHRSVALAEGIGDALHGYGLTFEVIHRDVAKPVIQK